MVYLFALAAAYVPALLWIVFFYSQDHYNRRPKRLVGVMFLLGLGATVPIGWVNEFLKQVLPYNGLGVVAVVAFFTVAAFGEELLKLFFGVLGFGRSEVEEPVDGIVYMTTLALGFAAAETTTYIVNTYQKTLVPGTPDLEAIKAAFIVLAPYRGLVTALGHAAWSGIVGYALAGGLVGMSRRVVVPLALLLATGLHASFNVAAYAALDPQNERLLWVLPWLLALAIYGLVFRASLRRSPFRVRQWRARLLGLPMFTGLPPDRLEAAAKELKPRLVEPDEVVVRAGEPAYSFYIIAAGKFVLTSDDRAYGRPVRRVLGPGASFGQLGLLGTQVVETVTAETPGELLELERGAFYALVGDEPMVTARLLDAARGQAAADLVGAALRRIAVR